MKKITTRYDPGTAFFFQQNGIFDGTLTAGRSGVNPIASFQTLLRVHLVFFLNPHSYCVLSDPIHWVTEPAPLDENRNI